MKSIAPVLLALAAFQSMSHAAPPAFENTANPPGWTVMRGQVLEGAAVQSKDGAVNARRDLKALLLQSAAPLASPMQATFRFRAAIGDTVTLRALTADEPTANEPTADKAPLLQLQFVLRAENQAALTAFADGQPMATDITATRPYQAPGTPRPTEQYSWRYLKARNLWDERDRNEIGLAFSTLTPFANKVFTARLLVTPQTRQIWVDDRLLAESRIAGPKQVRFSMELEKTARVLSADFETPPAIDGRFVPLSLDHYSHAAAASSAFRPETLQTTGASAVPIWKAGTPEAALDLGASLYRYRVSNGGGPETASVGGKAASYINAKLAWPGSFLIDPASLTFRVPYRDYQNLWLLAWVDDDPNAVAKGSFRFYKEETGHEAGTDFEISPEAIQRGLVTPLPQKAPGGQKLYLVKVPVNTSAFYGFRDQAGQSLDFELCKPVSLVRSYPDPIYYGAHPGGPRSSIHIAGLTLEESPFHYEVRPAKFAHVFERPALPQYDIVVGNATARPLDAKVTLQTKSFDGAEVESVTGNGKIEPGQDGTVPLRLDLKKNGWHELKTIVEAGGTRRETTLSLLVLPPNTRTYGEAANETRFGSWFLSGHYMPLRPAAPNTPTTVDTEAIAGLLRQLGIRRGTGFLGLPNLKKNDLLPDPPHTLVAVFHRLNENDPVALQKAVDDEVAAVGKLAPDFRAPQYLYGGEWAISKETHYVPWPLYTGDGDRALTEDEMTKVVRQTKILTAIGRGMRAKFPQTRLFLQWGAPQATLAFLRTGFSKDLVDGYGMDSPQFEMLPELSNVPGSINDLWTMRQEAKRLGWPRLPIAWVEGPFLPTNPGALTETQQAENQVRYWLSGLAYGIDNFDAGVVPFDAGNYYSAEHYGAGIFNRAPLLNPKPAAAAVATMTSMLCGADPVGGVPTGQLTTYCMAFERAKGKAKIYALWRVDGTVTATLKVRGASAAVTDSMGNATPLAVKNGEVAVELSAMPVWLTGAEAIEGFSFAPPRYTDAPPAVTRALPEFTPAAWSYDGTADDLYATNHFAMKRVTTPNLSAAFGAGEAGHAQAVAVTLAVEPGNRPLATRYGALKPQAPIAIPGRPRALGVWIKGNSSFGRVVYQLADAKGEIWTSTGTRDDWNCDDTHAWSYVKFEGWRYVSFPLPGNQPYDDARELESTWWGSRGGDGIVDYPLTVQKIFVEARNEVPYLGEMTVVPERSYKLSGLVAEYAAPEDATEAAIARARLRLPVAAWSGPAENPIATLQQTGAGDAPVIREFIEPGHFNDGRRMTIRFDQAPGVKYTLYLSRYADGRGADLLATNVTDQQIVAGMRPETEMFLFLTATGADGKESKPSAAYRLVTKDNFREK